MILNYAFLGSLNNDIFKPELEEKIEYTNEEMMSYELDLFGMYLSSHPVTSYKRNNNHIDLIDIKNYFDKVIETVIYVDRIRVIETKNKDAVLFPKVYSKYNYIKEKDILKIKGKVEKRYDEYQIIVANITKLN